MRLKSEIHRNLGLLKGLWKNRVPIRNLLKSNNIKFVSDFPPGHFYSPIPDILEIRKNAGLLFDQSIECLPGINLNAACQLRLLGEFANLAGSIPFSDHKSGRLRYYFDNPYFSYGDGIILYSIIRHFKPRNIVEVGSGYSSAAMMDINDLFFDRQINFEFIEPYPGRLLKLLAREDLKRCRLETTMLQNVPLSIFDALGENDVLFIDSSHVGKAGSDVLHILFRILPRLKRGVLVHFHDILWPFEYPQTWIEEGRAWNEAYFLRAFLLNNTDWEMVYFNSYMALHHRKAIEIQAPNILKSPTFVDTIGNSSLWLRKVV